MSSKLYTEEQVRVILNRIVCDNETVNEYINRMTPIELPSDEEIESKYNKFIDTEIKLGFLLQSQGERLKWYYKTYFINKIGGKNEQ